MADVLLVVTATLPEAPTSAPRPRKDYSALAQALNANTLDRSAATRTRIGRVVNRVLGIAAAQAVEAFRRRNDYTAIVTDGEHIGIPLALLLKLARASTAHVTIGHRISAAKKRPFFRWLKVHTHMDRIIVHAERQLEVATQLGIPASRMALVPYQVDTEFWRPIPGVLEERLVCSAGREFRDYPTLFRAVDGLDTRVVVGAASHWSKRHDSAQGGARPANVEVSAFDYCALRDLYARAAVVVVPLDDVDFQAGVTTILEAMAMSKAVVVTHSQGQTDVIEDRRRMTRGHLPRERPAGLLRQIAEAENIELEPTGFYVLPSDAAGLRSAIAYLLDHPEERTRLGAAGRRTVERLATLDHYVTRIGRLVNQAVAGRSPMGSGGGAHAHSASQWA